MASSSLWSDEETVYTPDGKAQRTAKKRRDSTTATVAQLAGLLPLPNGTNREKLKMNHILRLAVNYIRMKHLLQGSIMPLQRVVSSERSGWSGQMTEIPQRGSPMPKKRRLTFPASFQLPSEDVLNALDGFLLVVSSQADDMEILYVSESVFTHLGICMVDLVGQSLFNLVVEQDHEDVKDSLAIGDEDIFRRRCFFCKVKSAKGKRPNGRTKSPGQKLIHVVGQMHQYQQEAVNDASSSRGEVVFVGIARVVTSVSVAEPCFGSCLTMSRTPLELKVLEVNSSEEVGKRALKTQSTLKEKSGSSSLLSSSQQTSASSSSHTMLSPPVISPPVISPPSESAALQRQDLYCGVPSDVIGSNCIGAQLLPPCSSVTEEWDNTKLAESCSHHELSPQTDQEQVSSWIGLLNKPSSPPKSETSYAEIEPMFSDFTCPGDRSKVGMENNSLEAIFKTEFPLWDSPCSLSPVATSPDQPVSASNSWEPKQSDYPSFASGFSLSPKRLPIAKGLVSSPNLTDWGVYSPPTEDEWDFPDFPLSMLGQLSPEGHEIQPMPLHSTSAEKWSMTARHFVETAGVPLPAMTTDARHMAPFSSAGHNLAPDPVWTVRVADTNPQSASGQLESDINDASLSQAPPLTWDWAVGIDFDQTNNLTTDNHLAATTYPRQLDQHTIDVPQWNSPDPSLGHY